MSTHSYKELFSVLRDLRPHVKEGGMRELFIRVAGVRNDCISYMRLWERFGYFHDVTSFLEKDLEKEL